MTFFEVIKELSTTHLMFKKGGFSDGLKFNQYERTISVGDTVLFDKGKIIPQTLTLRNGVEFYLTEDMGLIEQEENPYEKLEEYYEQFKTSIPNEYSKYLKSNFLCKAGDQLTQAEFNSGIPRQRARATLEAYVMLTQFPWENERHHYWQSKKDKSLILYRDWR